jgi:YHS domain-containing protein
MSAFMSSMASAGPPSQTAAPATASVAGLVSRLSAEVASAAKRIHELQTEAAKEFLGQEQRSMLFVPLADRIQEILQPRIDAFMNVDVFKDIQQSVSLERQGADGRRFHGRMTRLVVPYSDGCPATVDLSFHLGHDGPLENAFLDYKLDIVPIFIKFDSYDQLMIPIANPNEGAIATWIDDKLVEFTRTYFKLYFTDQYQKLNLETDPVMSIRFPRAFAAGTKEYVGRTYHFYTVESLRAFEQCPSEYVATS